MRPRRLDLDLLRFDFFPVLYFLLDLVLLDLVLLDLVLLDLDLRVDLDLLPDLDLEPVFLLDVDFLDFLAFDAPAVAAAAVAVLGETMASQAATMIAAQRRKYINFRNLILL